MMKTDRESAFQTGGFATRPESDVAERSTVLGGLTYRSRNNNNRLMDRIESLERLADRLSGSVAENKVQGRLSEVPAGALDDLRDSFDDTDFLLARFEAVWQRLESLA